MPQNTQTGSGTTPSPIKQSFWGALRKRWYYSLPIGLVVLTIVIGFAWQAIIVKDINDVAPLNLHGKISYGTYGYGSVNKYAKPVENVTLLSPVAPWIDARNNAFIKEFRNSPSDEYGYWDAKTLQWESAKWGVSCNKAGGKIAYSSGMGGNTYYCVTGRYADAGNSCSTNEDCISKKCMHQDDSDDLICVGPKCRHCAYYENWNGPNMIDR